MIFAERFWGAEVDREVVYEVYVGVCAWYSIGMLTHDRTSRGSQKLSCWNYLI